MLGALFCVWRGVRREGGTNTHTHTNIRAALSFERGWILLAAYLEPSEKEEHVRRVLACAHCMLAHFRRQEEEAAIDRLRYTLTQLLGQAEASRLLSSQSCTVQAMSDISGVVRRSRSQMLNGSTRARFDVHLDALNQVRGRVGLRGKRGESLWEPRRVEDWRV